MKRNILLVVAIAFILAIATISTYAAADTVNAANWSEVYMENYSVPSSPVVIDDFNLLDGANVDLTQIVQLNILTEYDTFTGDGISGFANAIMSGSQIFDMLEETNDFFAKTSANDTVILSRQNDGTFKPQVVMIGDAGNMFALTSSTQMQLSSFGLYATPDANAKFVGIPGMGSAIVFSDGENELISFTVSRFPELVADDTLYTVNNIATIMAVNEETITGEEIGEKLPESITLNQSTATVSVGSNFTLAATVLPANATNKTVTWTSSHNNIATVNSSGVVTGASAGTATITATTVNGLTATCQVTVNGGGLPESIRIEAEELYSWSEEGFGVLLPYTTAQVYAYSSQDNTLLEGVTWHSSNPNVATIDENGFISSMDYDFSDGEYTTITATFNGVTAELELWVAWPITAVPETTSAHDR